MARTDLTVRIGQALILAFGIGWLLWWWNTWEEEQASRTSAGVTTVSPATGPVDVRIDASMSSGRVAEGETESFSILIQNPHPTPVSVQFLSFSANPGFTPSLSGSDALCWRNGKPVCVVTPSGDVARTMRWPWTLAPGDAVTVVARVRATEEGGRWSLRGVLSSRSGSSVLTKLVNIGPVVVESRVRSFFQTTLKATQKYLKDLGLPIIAAILGYWFKKEDERRAQLHGVYQLMLPKIHAQNAEYYLPISQAASRFLKYARDMPADPSAAGQCFFFFWIFHRRVSDMSAALGGWYMKSRIAEDLLGDCWTAILDWTLVGFKTDHRTGRELHDQAVSNLKTGQLRYAEFRERHASRTLFLRLRDRFDELTPMPSFAVIVAIVSVFELVLDYEINRSYQFWYEEMTPFDIADFEKRVKALTDAYATATAADLLLPHKILNGVFDEIKKYRAYVLSDGSNPATLGVQHG